tara:strand:+ start:79 stop:579 length:501 start_codon:yes stop_codon:yes gene_type:complete
MQTVNIKGKKYVEVHERVTHLRNNYKTAQLLTEIISNNNGMCVMKATLYIDDKIVSTGHAYEKEDSNYINKTSYIENCETSAVGRCLGNYGIGINSSIASADEVMNAINKQEQKPKEHNEWEKKLLEQANNDESVLLSISDSWRFGIKTEKQYYWFVKQLVDRNYK